MKQITCKNCKKENCSEAPGNLGFCVRCDLDAHREEENLQTNQE